MEDVHDCERAASVGDGETAAATATSRWRCDWRECTGKSKSQKRI